jgi:tetratricopeptide (TPR) repeat protein
MVSFIPNEAFSFAHNAKLLAFTDNKEAYTVAWRKIIPMLKWLGYYFALAVFGHRLAMFHSYNGKYLIDSKATEKTYKDIDAYLIIGALVLLTTIALIPFALPHTAAWGLLWFTVNAIVFCNFVNVGNMLTTSRYTYIANAGVALAVAHVAYQYPVIGGLAFGWYLARIIYAMMQYRNEYWSNSFAVIEEPYYEHSWILHGNHMFARKNFKAAAQDYVEALRFYPNSFKANYNLSGALLCMGDLQRSIACLEQAKKCHLMGQREYANTMIAEREKIIGIVYEATKEKKPYDLKMKDIPIVV